MTQRRRGRTGLVNAGEMPLVKHFARKARPPTPVQLELIEVSVAIEEQPDAAERAFMARQFVLCTLPHSDPGNIPVWKRVTGNGALGIQPGVDLETERSIGYPYGVIPRLLLFWMTTEVQHTKNRADLSLFEKRTLYLGQSLDGFLRAVGLNPDTGGGKRGDAKRLHNQMDRLFTSRISFQQKLETDRQEGRARGSMEIAPDSELWWDPKRPKQRALWQSWIRLSEKFYNALAASPVPIDMRALRALKRSPLALDLYALISYRAFVIIQKRLPPQFVSWKALRDQLGTDYADPRDLQKSAMAALRKIVILYPGLKIITARGGFHMHATRLAVQTRVQISP